MTLQDAVLTSIGVDDTGYLLHFLFQELADLCIFRCTHSTLTTITHIHLLPSTSWNRENEKFGNFHVDNLSYFPFCLYYYLVDRPFRGLINYKDTKANCHHLKKFTCQGTLRQVFIRVYRR
jgi:hypothetical protein